MKNSKKYILSALLIVLVICVICTVLPPLVLGGNIVSANDNYIIVHNNSEYHMYFLDSYRSYNTESSLTDDNDFCVSAPSIKFASFAEMKSDIQSGNFTKSEMDNIVRFNRNKQGYVQTLNVTELCEPNLPVAFGLNLSHVTWYGNSYTVTYNWLLDYESSSSSVLFWSKEFFEEEVARLFTDYAQALKNVNRNVNIHYVSTEESRNATIVQYTSASGQDFRTILYSISEKGKTLYILENYCLDNKGHDFFEVSEEIPYMVQIYGTEYGKYFCANLHNLPTRPTMEELSSVGMRKYTETDAS